jgi:predicted transcriptional regulator
MKIILSIKPDFVKEIFAGRKKYEYRKSVFSNKEVNSVIVYCTMPVGKIVGEFSIEKVECEKPAVLWEKTKDYSGISKDFFDEYFNGREKAYALKISSIKKYKDGINPENVIKSFMAPQSFRYLSHSEINRLHKIAYHEQSII